jgi:hypothetical protein
MQHMSSTIRSFFGLLLLSSSAASLADQLALTNGDVINGTMQEKTEDQVLWLSDNFGLLAIDKARIATLNGAALDAPTTVLFSNTYHGDLSFTGGYSSGNITREDWDLDGDVEWRHGDFRHSSEINF